MSVPPPSAGLSVPMSVPVPHWQKDGATHESLSGVAQTELIAVTNAKVSSGVVPVATSSSSVNPLVGHEQLPVSAPTPTTRAGSRRMEETMAQSAVHVLRLLVRMICEASVCVADP